MTYLASAPARGRTSTSCRRLPASGRSAGTPVGVAGYFNEAGVAGGFRRPRSRDRVGRRAVPMRSRTVLRLGVGLALVIGAAAAGAAKKAKPPLKPRYIDNRVVRLGVDLGSGGSVFYFAQSATKRNLLNHRDLGRFVQQSYYGRKDGSVWVKKPWRWNPVQGGDYKGHPARLLDSKITPTSVYTKSIPKNSGSAFAATSPTSASGSRTPAPRITRPGTRSCPPSSSTTTCRTSSSTAAGSPGRAGSSRASSPAGRTSPNAPTSAGRPMWTGRTGGSASSSRARPR